MDDERPVATVAVVVAVDPVAPGGLMAHLLRDGESERQAVCGTADEATFVVVELDWARLPAARRCARCHTWSGLATAS